MRTHDTAGMWGGAHYVDIPNVFPDFDADENDPASYDFAFTDDYLKPLVEAGCQPFCRLGESAGLTSVKQTSARPAVPLNGIEANAVQ